MTKLLSIFATIVLFSSFSFGQTRNTTNTLKLDAGASGAAATIKDLAWLTGAWLGEGLGGVSEEMWSAPANGRMMGNYRLEINGKPVFYEFMLMVEMEGTLLLRIKHFNPDMTGWEEKDKSVDFKFVKKDGNRVYFSGLTFENLDKNSLNIYLALKQKDGTLKEESFRLKRTL